MAEPVYVFISSKMEELARERALLHRLLPTLSHHNINFQAWVFESDAVATERTIRQQYLAALQQCRLYIGLFRNEFGEATIDEFNHAGKWGIPRHIYIKNDDPNHRDPRLQFFLDQHGQLDYGTSAKWYTNLTDFEEAVTNALTAWAQEEAMLRPGSATGMIYRSTAVLPSPRPPALIGRDDLLKKVSDRMRAKTHVLLNGYGGVGKSTLAAAVVADWIRDGHGAALWLRCGKDDGEQLLDALVQPLPNADAIRTTSSLEERVNLLANTIAESAISLVVLDDVWNGSALHTLLEAIPTTLPVLITSRLRLWINGETIEIGTLTPDQALKVLESYAGRAFADKADALALCEALAYHPLALSIAGRTIHKQSTSRGQLTPRDFLRRFDDITEISVPHDMSEARQRNIGRVIETSLRMLGTTTRLAFLAIGAFYGPTITPDLLKLYLKYAHPDRELDVQDSLDQLVDHHLIEPVKVGQNGAVMYQFHALSYSYARANQPCDTSAAVIQACTEYALLYQRDLNALDLERGVLLGAMEATNATGDLAAIAPLVEILLADCDYFATRGLTRSTIAIVEDVLRQAAQQNPPWYDIETLHYLHTTLGDIWIDQFGDRDRALIAKKQALDFARQIPSALRETLTMVAIGRLRYTKEIDLKAYFEPFLEQYAADRVRFGALQHLGTALAMDGALDQAYGYLEESVQIARRAAETDPEWDQDSLVAALQSWGTCSLHLGIEQANNDLVIQATTIHEEAYALASKYGFTFQRGDAARMLGEDHYRQGRHKLSVQYLQEAFQIYTQLEAEEDLRELLDFVEANAIPLPTT